MFSVFSDIAVVSFGNSIAPDHSNGARPMWLCVSVFEGHRAECRIAA
jgi:hypothetical protein